MPNVVASGQTNVEIWWFFIFQDGGRNHLGFINFHSFNCWNVQEVHIALSCQISWRSVKLSRRYADFFIFPIWRLSANLDLWCTCLDHPRRAFGGLYHCAKFGWFQCSSFNNMHFFWFCESGLKMRIQAPKIGVSGDSNETFAPIANLPNSAQLVAVPTTHWSYIRVRAIVWTFRHGQTDRHTDVGDHKYISHRLRLMRNVIIILSGTHYWLMLDCVGTITHLNDI